MSAIDTLSRSNRTNDLMTVDEVADWLGVASQTLYYWRHTRRGPRSLSVGRAVRYRAEDVEEWLARGAREPRQ